MSQLPKRCAPTTAENDADVRLLVVESTIKIFVCTAIFGLPATPWWPALSGRGHAALPHM
jgi:hypothetical protein